MIMEKWDSTVIADKFRIFRVVAMPDFILHQGNIDRYQGQLIGCSLVCGKRKNSTRFGRERMDEVC